MAHNGVEYVMLQALADVYNYANKDVVEFNAVMRSLQRNVRRWFSGGLRYSRVAILRHRLRDAKLRDERHGIVVRAVRSGTQSSAQVS